MKKTLVLGASENPRRYSNLAIIRLRQKDISVEAVGKIKGKVTDVEITDEKKDFENIHTITIYLNPENQKEYYNYILRLKPQRVIFNPGAENPVFKKQLTENNIEAINACTLVLLSIGEY